MYPPEIQVKNRQNINSVVMVPLRIRVVPELEDIIVLGQPLLHSYKSVIFDNSAAESGGEKIHFVPLNSRISDQVPLPGPSIIEVDIGQLKIVEPDLLEGGYMLWSFTRMMTDRGGLVGLHLVLVPRYYASPREGIEEPSSFELKNQRLNSSAGASLVEGIKLGISEAPDKILKGTSWSDSREFHLLLQQEEETSDREAERGEKTSAFSAGGQGNAGDPLDVD